MTDGYVKRRERMPALMKSAFKKLGFERSMYLFRKYSRSSMADYDELLDQAVPPWYISDDTCGHRPSPPVPFSLIFVVILTTCDEEGKRYRQILRGQGGASSLWLSRLATLQAGSVRWLFVVPIQEDNSRVLADV